MDRRQHIQNHSDAAALEPHWGYADRVVPCTNDAGSCAYLDVVYHAHDVGMLYVGIMWAVIGAGLLLWGILHRSGTSTRLTASLSAAIRRRLLPEFRKLRYVFGRTTRLQVLVLGAIVAYLTIFSFAGIKYATWITPVKNTPGVYNRRSSLGPFADRVGVLAYALTPLSVLLASRESLLSIVTGIPYQHFNFLHRWLGHVIMLQAVLHTIGWCIIEIRFYQPQPKVAKAWIVQEYMIWGVVAMILLILLWGLSTSWARRRFGYEFFRKAHYVLAMVYIGACWAHWAQLKCFMLPSLLLWFADRGARLARTALIHYHMMPDGKGMFQTIPATITHFEADVFRLDLKNPDPLDWHVGQHFYVCFAENGIWQSHPFTPLSLPSKRQSYLVRAKDGETKRIAALDTPTTPIILTGPYGADIMDGLEREDNVLCVAGGTGITFVLPVLLQLSRTGLTTGRLIQLTWVVRHERDVDWIADELDELKQDDNIKVIIRTTRDSSRASDGQVTPLAEAASYSNSDTEKAAPDQATPHCRPDLHNTAREFTSRTVQGKTCVYVSGPGGMISDVREEVASCNDASRIWRGEHSADVRLIYDERLD